jgi:hypothetical protein
LSTLSSFSLVYQKGGRVRVRCIERGIGSWAIRGD